MRIYLDLDMTLNSMAYDWCASLGITPKDVLYFGWIRDALGPEADKWWSIPGIYDFISPLPGAELFVESLEEVIIITHTHPSQNPKEKEAWIVKHFGSAIKDVIHTDEKYKHTSNSILIDDHPRHIHDHIRHNNAPGILFNHKNNYGWSKPLRGEDKLVMVDNYPDAYAKISYYLKELKCN